MKKELQERKEFLNLNSHVCAVDCRGKYSWFSMGMWNVKNNHSEIMVKEKPIKTTEFLQ